jgi:hypothetical protein
VSTGRVRVVRHFGFPTVGVLGVVAVILVGLQTGVSAFKPPPGATVLLVLVGLCVGLALERAATLSRREEARRNREARLDALLRRWPLVTVDVIDPHELGVFPSDVVPAKKKLLPRYVPRDIDDALRGALERHSFVLIFGPTNAGKSRTAYEAAAKVLGDARVSIPEDGDALHDLLELKGWRDGEGWPELLWLDGLERYLPSLDRGSLDKLAATWPNSRIVATMRDVDYELLFRQSGNLAEAGKRILRRARTFKLEREPSAKERKAAMRLYRDLDFEQGIGSAFAADWRDGHEPPPARPTPTPEPAPDARQGRDHLLAGLLGGGALVAVLALGLWAAGQFAGPEPVSRQLARVLDDATEAHQRVVFNKTVDFRGTGEKEHVLVLHDRALEADAGGASAPSPGEALARSDELRVYDVRHSKLVEVFQFSPEHAAGGASYVFRPGMAKDLDGNGSEEMIGGFARFDSPTIQPVPVTVFWDDETKSYAIEALDTAPPALKPVSDPGRGAKMLRAEYRRPVELRDGKTTTGYPVKDFAVVDGGTGPKLITSFVTRARTLDDVSDIEIQTWSLRFASGHPRLAVRCVLLGAANRPLVFQAVPRLPLPTFLVQIWKRYDSRALC